MRAAVQADDIIKRPRERFLRVIGIPKAVCRSATIGKLVFPANTSLKRPPATATPAA